LQNLCFTKKIRYASRKQLAEARPRVKGQFVRRDKMAGAPEDGHGQVDGSDLMQAQAADNMLEDEYIPEEEADEEQGDDIMDEEDEPMVSGFALVV